MSNAEFKETSAFRQWLAMKLPDAEPLGEDELLLAFEASCRYGSANGWTGETGALAAIIRNLLVEIGRLGA